MALAGESELFKILVDAQKAQAKVLGAKRRTYQNKSFVPYVYEDLPGGFCFEFDYEYEIESPDDAPIVLVTDIRLTSHDGTEYPIKVGSVCPRWLAEIESLISDEIAAENEAYWESRR